MPVTDTVEVKRLYNVSIERTIMVMADSEDDAERLALRSEREEISNEPDFVSANLVTGRPRIPEPWRDSLPYGGDDDMTCAQIQASQSDSNGGNNV